MKPCTCSDPLCPDKAHTETSSRLPACSIAALKDELIEFIQSRDLDDTEELCLDSQKLIVGWINLFFEDKIYDMQQQ